MVACDACLDVSCSAPTGTPSPPEVFQLFAYCTWSPDGREAPEGFAEIKDNRIWLRDLGWTGWGCMPAFTAPCGGKGGGGCLYQASPLHDFGNGQLYSKPVQDQAQASSPEMGIPCTDSSYCPGDRQPSALSSMYPKQALSSVASSMAGTALQQEHSRSQAAALSHTSTGRGAVTKPPPLSVSPFSISESAVASKYHRMDFSGTWKAECHAGSLSLHHWGSNSPFCLR